MHTQIACRLRIYTDDSDSHEGQPFYEWLVAEAHRQGMRGATVLRGSMGFGGHGEIHSSKLLALSADLPIIVEIIDSREKVHEFIAVVDDVLHKGLATIEEVETAFFWQH